MHKFVRNLITEWRRLKLPLTGDTVIVAVSGGADSVSLLLALHDLKKRAKLDLRIVAAHLNHQLRGSESDMDEEFVRQLTTELHIELALHKSHIPQEGNLEQNARAARYAFLSEIAKNLDACAVLTGHTVNDQAETFLLNLIRGSGVQGLGAMKTIRDLSDGDAANYDPEPTLFPLQTASIQLIRPLLNWAKREDTEGLCRDMGVEFRYDTMNEDLAFTRVRIRKILLPLLEEFNPKIIETLANTAETMRELTPAAAMPVETEDNGLILKPLKLLSKADLYDTIRSWLRQHRGNTRQLQLKHIQAIERLIFSEKSGRIAELPGGSVTKTDGKLVYEENKVEN